MRCASTVFVFIWLNQGLKLLFIFKSFGLSASQHHLFSYKSDNNEG